MSITEEMLKNDIELAKGVTQLTAITESAIALLARAILELDEAKTLKRGTYQALMTLSKDDAS